MASLVRDTPIRRFRMLEEVAMMAVFLASEESAYVTGLKANIEGGLLVGSASAPR